jgi:ADP-heptose:LPS heptosyltransferase
MAFEKLWAWRRHLKRSFHYTNVIAATRAKGIWPEARRGALEISGRRILAIRRDRLGDAMLSVPFLSRLLASGADVRVLLLDEASRALLGSAGVCCVGSVEELGDWRPEGALFLERCRHLRSELHPERWQFVEEMLRALQGVPCVIPTMRRAEAMSYFPGSYCTPFSGLTALSLLRLFADGLELPAGRGPLFEKWIAPDEVRAAGRVVFSLSAGVGGETGRRYIPLPLWEDIARRLADAAPLACMVAPGDDARREAFESLRRQGGLPDCELHCYSDITAATEWLGRQRLLVSPETGLCHLVRNLRLPMVVLTPERQIPYWYQRTDDTRYVFAELLRDVDAQDAATAIRELLEREPAR